MISWRHTKPLVFVVLALTAVSTFCGATPFTFLTTAQAAQSKLGDLSEFRRIVIDASSLVDKGNLVQARTRIKDLEMSWDEAERSLKPRAAGDWHKVDKSIDQALSALREKTPDPAACRQALTNLLTVMDQMNQS